MKNQAMLRKLEAGQAIDVSRCKRTNEGDYILTHFAEDVDYCNAETEEWIWSIGQDLSTGEILASHSSKFYQNADFNCLWLR